MDYKLTKNYGLDVGWRVFISPFSFTVHSFTILIVVFRTISLSFYLIYNASKKAHPCKT